MRNWVIGAVLVVISAVIQFALVMLGAAPRTATIAAVSVAVFGFGLQMYTAFSMRARFEREIAESQMAHVARLKRASELPPKEAIALLLGADANRSGG